MLQPQGLLLLRARPARRNRRERRSLYRKPARTSPRCLPRCCSMRSSFLCCHTTPYMRHERYSSHNKDRFPRLQEPICRFSRPAAYWKSCRPYRYSGRHERSCMFRLRYLLQSRRPYLYTRKVCRRCLLSHLCLCCRNHCSQRKGLCYMPARRSQPGPRLQAGFHLRRCRKRCTVMSAPHCTHLPVLLQLSAYSLR